MLQALQPGHLGVWISQIRNYVTTISLDADTSTELETQSPRQHNA